MNTKNNNYTILIVEDDQGERDALARLLKYSKYNVMTAVNADQALGYLDEPVDLVVSDLRMGKNSGIDLLRFWKEKRPNVPFIMVTAFGEVNSAVEAMKLGADDYLAKPVHPEELLMVIERCLQSCRKETLIENLSERLDKKLGFENIVGQSQPMLDVFARIRRAATADSTILITGESGTGKELAAEAIHQNSPRKKGAFVAVNMAAVPQNLAESELFGHVRGAFTGATTSRIGKFEAADGGTLFIDEIGDFPLESQAKLLRVLESKTITPVGGNTEKEVDVRVVAATSRNLDEMVIKGEFREDLYYRLSVVWIHQPPLRERSEDIPLLINYFLEDLCQHNGRETKQCDPDLSRYLATYPWPGNVRQLRNCLESMVVMATDSVLTMDDLPANILRKSMSDEAAALNIPSDTSMEELERNAIEQALKRFNGNRTLAAESLGISTRTLQRRLKQWQLAV